MKRRPQGNGRRRQNRQNSNPVLPNHGWLGPRKRIEPGHIFAPECPFPGINRASQDNLGPPQIHFATWLFAAKPHSGGTPISHSETHTQDPVTTALSFRFHLRPAPKPCSIRSNRHPANTLTVCGAISTAKPPLNWWIPVSANDLRGPKTRPTSGTLIAVFRVGRWTQGEEVFDYGSVSCNEQRQGLRRRVGNCHKARGYASFRAIGFPPRTESAGHGATDYQES